MIGGTGYLGSAMRQKYHSAFKKIVNFGKKNEAGILYENETYFNISDCTSAEVLKILNSNEVSTIIDFAYSTVPKTSFDNPVGDFSDNLFLVNKHLDAVRNLASCKYIYVSSGGTVYGNAPLVPVRESEQNFPLSPYGITKMACERYVNMYHHVHGLYSVIIRPSNIYGPGQLPFKGQGFIATAMGAAFNGQELQVFGDGTHVRDYLYIDDFCDALVDIIKFGKSSEIYNIGSGEGKSLNQIISSINKITLLNNKPLHVRYLPSRQFDVRYNVLNHDKLSSLNGWNIKTVFQEGISQTWQWIQNFLS